MSIKLYLPRYLTHNIMKGDVVSEVNGKTIGECLIHFVTLNPKMREVVFSAETGKATERC